MQTQRPRFGTRPRAGLIDRFGRRITYLRLSLTDRCNFRCIYCMTSDTRFARPDRLLSLDELAAVAAAFTDLGVHKIRLTGGEPLMRRGAIELMRRIASLPGLCELVITTNGAQLERLAVPLREAGVRRINISLDSLRPERFRSLTRTGDLAQVLHGIDAAIAAGFERIKLNAVILKGRNHDEILDLARFALAKGINLSFIEEMPFGTIGEHDRAETYYPTDRIREELAAKLSLIPTTETTGGPARYYRIPGSQTRLGLISPRSHNFCNDCNRVRVTAEGRLLLCLGNEHSLDLRALLRAHSGDITCLRNAITAAMGLKPEGCDLGPGIAPIAFRRMSMTGG
ncbi:MAG: GTP 3',8-cyclase MoaA [Gammaproteobacteria bacterium]|nr:GTP 3',8-cyclase MoaA [Gammaproteobacteria bacterium]